MKHICCLCTVLILVCMASLSQAASGHYTSGVEGIRAASVPPPSGSGLYWKMYNVVYSADGIIDDQDNSLPGDFDLTVYAMANRLIYSSNITVLGGNLLFDMIVPLVYTDISYQGIGPASFDDSQFGLGDIFLEPFFIGWHGKRWDALAAIGFYLPTGKFDQKEPASAGMGFWTTMFSLGGTVYFDQEKTWSASILARYQIHSEQDETDITVGDHFSFEWGLGKQIGALDVGVSGYCLWQVNNDSGPGSDSFKERAYAIGPELGYTFKPLGLNVAFRSQWEFENRNRPEGNITTLNFTYAF